MKKSICFALLLSVASFSTLNAKSSPEEDVITKAHMVDNKVMVLTLANLQQNNASITITDFKNELIYFTRNIRKHNGFSSRLNLQKLPIGKYVMTVRTNGKVLRQIIYVKADQVFLSMIK